MSKDIKFKSKMHHPLDGKQLSIGQAVQYVVEEFLSTSLSERLENLSDRLKSADPELSERITKIKAEFLKDSWGRATCKDDEWQIEMTIGEAPRAECARNEDGSVSMPHARISFARW